MEKLIELLNEYEVERESKIETFKDMKLPIWEWYEICDGLVFEPIDSSFNGEAFSDDTANSVVISKHYGFIKWLVDNDKIDFESKVYPLKKYYPYFNDDVLAIVSQDCNTYEDHCRVCYDKYESLLMLLAISDTPIDDLISYLK